MDKSPEDTPGATLRTWLAVPMDAAARSAVRRVCRADDVVHVAVMPDVHLATDVCVGTAMATRRLLYPSAVGGDIGCGMLAVAFDAAADVARDPGSAGAILRALNERIPAQRLRRSAMLPVPESLNPSELSHPTLAAAFKRDGRLQLGTLGGGNHFVELQADESDRLWLMVHSGSRAVGQAVRDHHVSRATVRSAGMVALDADTDAGRDYLRDQDWARRFAAENRRAMARQVVDLIQHLFAVQADLSTTIACDHNHVRRETYFGQSLLVHRKGAMLAEAGAPGVVPGSMGTLSFHVAGKGCAEALRSSAHGAGRLLSRQAARERFALADLRRQMGDVWFDPRMDDALREESPQCYKDVRAVLRAQADLVTVTRTLRPVLVYKGR